MHELAIAQSLIEQIEKVVREQAGKRAVAVTVRIGPLSGVDADALRMAFEIASPDTLAAGCVLELEAPHAVLRCRACGAATELALVFRACESCGSADVTVEGGHELLLRSLELET
jgi:hydrogenase nickel incorporation protein HypA/HybF